jgi:protein-S-isoprenylcysteine O-methyltransferase Ste14
MRTNVVTLAAALTVLAIYVFMHKTEPWTPTRIAGAVIALAALPPFVLARIQLGGSFSVRAKAQTLVTHGIYSRIRNPFGGLFIAGAILYLEKPWLLCIFLLIIPLQIHRARNEAKVLEEKFGAEYARYKSQTWF